MAKVPHPLLSIQASLLDPNPNKGHLESFHLARGLAGRGGGGGGRGGWGTRQVRNGSY